MKITFVISYLPISATVVGRAVTVITVITLAFICARISTACVGIRCADIVRTTARAIAAAGITVDDFSQCKDNCSK